jgi:hypothetical protein
MGVPHGHIPGRTEENDRISGYLSGVGNKITAFLHVGAQTGASGRVGDMCLRWRLRILFVQNGSEFSSLSGA